MLPNKIIPKSEWNNLAIGQLLDVKSQITSTYYNLRSINATFANQYLQFITEIDNLITKRQIEAEQENL